MGNSQSNTNPRTTQFHAPSSSSSSSQIPSRNNTTSNNGGSTATSDPDVEALTLVGVLALTLVGVFTMSIFMGVTMSSIYIENLKMKSLTKHLKSLEKGSSRSSKDDGRTTSKDRLTTILQKLHGRTGKEVVLNNLTQEEQLMVQDIIDPDDIEYGFKDIGGLDDLKQEIYELVVMTIKKPQILASAVQSTKLRSKLQGGSNGIMLYGKPGVGKTLIAKAIAKESGSVFLSLELSKIKQQYMGESEQLIAATFTLARKLAPTVIFFDEMDSIFNVADQNTNKQYYDNIKKVFLTHMDGISSSLLINKSSNTNKGEASSQKQPPPPLQRPVLVLGATNRPQDIDPAILRRLPRSFKVPLPDSNGRRQILDMLLEGQAMDDSATAFISNLASDEYTEGYSGSDLKELCCVAVMEPVREQYASEAKNAVGVVIGSQDDDGGDGSYDKKKKKEEKGNISDDDDDGIIDIAESLLASFSAASVDFSTNKELTRSSNVNGDATKKSSAGGTSVVTKQSKEGVVATGKYPKKSVPEDIVATFGEDYPVDVGLSKAETIQKDPLRFFMFVAKGLAQEYQPEKLRLLDALAVKYNKGRREQQGRHDRVLIENNLSDKCSNDGDGNTIKKENLPKEKEGVSLIRPVSKQDFLMALEKVKKTGKAAEDYGKDESAPSQSLINSIYS